MFSGNAKCAAASMSLLSRVDVHVGDTQSGTFCVQMIGKP